MLDLRLPDPKVQINLLVETAEHSKMIFIPYLTDEQRRMGIGGIYWRTGEDPMIAVLQQSLNEPCHNCNCYRAEISDLKRLLDKEGR